MKLPCNSHPARLRRRESGMAVIVVLALVSILLLYVACNIRTLSNLGQELKLLERRQIRRLELSVHRTNNAAVYVAPAVATVHTNAPEASR